jgi:hypothetical protein
MQRFFYTQTLLHRDAFDRQWQARLHANACTGWCVFHTRMLFPIFLKSHMLLHRTISTERYFYPEMRLHRDAFTHRNAVAYKYFCTHFFFKTLSNLTHISHIPKQTEVPLQRTALTQGAFTYGFAQTYFYMIRDGRPAFGAKEFSKHANLQFHPQLLTIEMHFVGEGRHGTNPHCNLTSMYDDRHFVTEGWVLWT